ncbi:MAG TPA: 1-acyl-sn-glycerol-3-phosphate acyltransferase [Gammaproteobacteria bacterium]|jgi:1-acyl-sn-glycerol-3-phosphate acyltransferase|nr:lysophospholipid acyltransferase family protein [Gammaproteobacteria bacterium]MDP6732584.1 lysophospholipid acyltransferase family protein [Gammaproteobacteria bacterium]HAJ74910.1 1-acyl-sn-glycerol-3-phosphate acyltransferase [Gammaproteobacteria bacterium]|tara:strand:+ start:1433 stop:2149 length:717 start_codon:yes stop_codon:yes gene_type:complete
MTSSIVLFFRSLLFYLGYVPITIFMSALFIILFPITPERGRHIFASTWCNAVLIWLGISCNIQYRIIGQANMPEQPVVILANHQSSWETMLFYKLKFPVSPILKKELMNIPFWGWAMRLQKPIAIDRAQPREAVKSLLTQGVERIKEGNSVIVFPEGTRSSSGEIRRFSRGGAKLAVAAGAPIVPIAHNAGDCWPARTFLKRPGTIRVVIGEPVPSAEKDANELTTQIEHWIRQQLLA